MKKQLNIKVTLNTSFNVEVEPNLKDWNEANDEERNIYVKTMVRDFLLEQVDEIIDELMNDSKIEF